VVGRKLLNRMAIYWTCGLQNIGKEDSSILDRRAAVYLTCGPQNIGYGDGKILGQQYGSTLDVRLAEYLK
jgi:hypothetical protein